MSMIRNDARLGKGPAFYSTVEDWEDYYMPGSVSAMIATGFTPIKEYFEHIYIKVETTDSQGAAQTNIVDVGFTLKNLQDDFITRYADRLMFMPRYPGTPNDFLTGYTRSNNRMTDNVITQIRNNTYKYLKLLETLGYDYNPIENYNLTEIKGAAEKEAPEEIKRSIIGDKVTTETDPAIKTSHYTTTFDDDATGRLETYDVSQYDGTHKTDDGVPVRERKERFEGDGAGETEIKTHNGSVTLTVDDITTSTNADRAATHKIVRFGRTGIDPTEYIQSQRDLVKFGIEREILSDIADSLLLSCY